MELTHPDTVDTTFWRSDGLPTLCTKEDLLGYLGSRTIDARDPSMHTRAPVLGRGFGTVLIRNEMLRVGHMTLSLKW